MTKAWTRWQDWAAVVLGVLLMLTPTWSETTSRAMWTMVVFGALLGLAGLWSLAMPGSVASEWTHMVLGALVFIAPWAMGYADMMGAAWTSWVVGVLAIAVGAAALPAASSAHQGLAGSH